MVTCPGIRTTSHTIFTLVSLDWDHLGWWLGPGFLGGRGFWKRFYPWESGKRTKNGHFLLYTRELESGQVLGPSPRAVHFREEEWCERLGSRNQVYFTYLSPELDIVMQTNYLCHNICRRMSYQISFYVSVCISAVCNGMGRLYDDGCEGERL